MRSYSASLPVEQYIPPPSPKEVWMQVRSAPRFDHFVELIEQQLDTAREVYIAQPASEFNRGKVVALKEMLHFVKTGELP